jgi:DNA-binding PadR family transcriptional regulator
MQPTPTDYILLAYLKDGPEHGYRLIDRLKSDNVQAVVRLSVPNVYQALRKLYRMGAIGLKTRKTRNRPEQKIYSLTESGRKLLEDFLADHGKLDQHHVFDFDLAFVLADKLDLDAQSLIEAIVAHIELLKTKLDDTQHTWRESEMDPDSETSLSEIAYRHQIRYLKNEIEFYRRLKKELSA